MNANLLPNSSRAAVFRGVRAPLAIEQFPLPALRGSEALVKIRCATICGSDLHSYHGRRKAPMPSILGHEMVGELAALGPAGVCDYRGAALLLGDRVTWSMIWSCGTCYFCQRGLPAKCERLMKFGHESITPDRALVGGMAEYCHLPERTAIFKVPDNLPDAVASSANCATATVAAVMRHAGNVAGQTVIVHGAGMLGQTACAMAAAGGAMHVIALEPDPRRREKSRQFGATEALDSRQPKDDLQQRIRELTAQRGADLALEFSGYPEAVELGIDLLRTGGRFVLAGATFPSRPVELLAEQIVRGMHQIWGVYNYQAEDLATALDFLARSTGVFPFEELVGRSFPLDEVNAAFDFAERQRPPRVAVIP